MESGLTKYSHASMLPVRQAIARILGQIDTAESVTVLMQMLNDPAPQIRRAAARDWKQLDLLLGTHRKLGELILDRSEDAQGAQLRRQLARSDTIMIWLFGSGSSSG